MSSLSFHSSHRGLLGQASARILALVLAVVAVVGVGLGTGSTASAQDCDALSIPALNVERCVIPGRQAEIDAGNVARVADLSTETGHWLAGHRSTHGSTFGALTDLAIGDVVVYRDQQYRIVEYTTARFANPGHVLGWTSMDVPTVVLQTSVDNVSAHLWRAEAIPPEEIAAAAAAEAEAQAAVLAEAEAEHDELVTAAVAAIIRPFGSGPLRSVTAMHAGF